MSNLKFASRIDTMHDTAIYMRGLFDNMTDPNMKSFGGGAPARSVLPMPYMEKIASEVLSDSGRGFEAFQYSAPFGLYDLREAVCDHLLKPTGIDAKPENIHHLKCVSKPKKVALGAVMRKLVNIIFAVLRDRKPFQLRSPEEHEELLFAKSLVA